MIDGKVKKTPKALTNRPNRPLSHGGHVVLRLKKLCFTTLDLAVKSLGARLDRKNKATLVSRDKMAAV